MTEVTDRLPAPGTDDIGPPHHPLLVAAAVVLVLVVTVVGVLQLLTQAVHGSTTDERVLRSAVPFVRIDAGDGDVELTVSPDDAVHVRTDSRYGLSAPTLTADTGPSGVWLAAQCDSFLATHCVTDYTVAVPAGYAVAVRGDAGRVSARYLTGRLDITLAGGNVLLTGLTGDVAVRTRFGDVTATGLRSTSVQAQTTAGDVTLALGTAPRSVVARSTRGNVDVTLPAGPYRVDALTINGRQAVTVPTDPAAAAAVSATTTDGDVTVHPG